MNWQKFQTYGDSPNQAFEDMCNQLFKIWCSEQNYAVHVVNGSGGDGGVEAYAEVNDGEVIGMQAKWFPDTLNTSQITQIKKSIITAKSIRRNLTKYIVAIPRSLGSLKKIKNGEIATNTEDIRWKDLKNSMEIQHPDLEVILWDELLILELLQRNEATGIFKYWFTHQDITFDKVEYSFSKQKSGWLRDRYVPEITKEGQIMSKISNLVGNTNLRANLIENVAEIIAAYNDLDKCISNYVKQFELKRSNEVLHDDLECFLDTITEKSNVLKIIKEIFYDDSNFTELIHESDYALDVNYIRGKLIEKLADKANDYLQIQMIIEEIEKAANLNFQSIGGELNSIAMSTLMLIGDPGVGKTNGVAKYASTLIDDKAHIPVLIRCKDINPKDSWGEILKNVLAISGKWDEIELWQALDQLASIMERKTFKRKPSEIHVSTKIIILLDGLDESKPYDAWFDRISELNELSNHYRRIKIVVTSRSYAIKTLSNRDLQNWQIFRIDSEGDVSVQDIFDRYIDYYGVVMSNLAWIKSVLRTPFSLRLFCENYRDNRIVGEVDPAALTITKLMLKRIKLLKAEFLNSLNGYPYPDKEINSILLLLAELFTEENQISHQVLVNKLSENIEIKSQDLLSLLDYCEKYGILQSVRDYSKPSLTELLSDHNYSYTSGNQMFLDYLQTIKVYDTNKFEFGNLSTIIDKIPESTFQNWNILNLLSILLLQDRDFLITSDKKIQNYISDKEELQLTAYVLSNVESEKTLPYVEEVTEKIALNGNNLRFLTENLIKVVARQHNHPLGPKILHAYLKSFDNRADRDFVWSVPNSIFERNNTGWLIPMDIMIPEPNELLEADKFDGLPIVYAWYLTNSDNEIRSAYRNELGRWSENNPKEFLLLLKYLIEMNDLQMMEDLFSVLTMSVLVNTNNESHLMSAFEFIETECFSSIGKINFLSSAIRYNIISIIKCLRNTKCISEDQATKFLPPYLKSDPLDIDPSALKGTRMGGFSPISYDLSRYVLIDPMESTFFLKSNDISGSQNDESIKDRLDRQFSKMEIEDNLASPDLDLELREAFVQINNDKKIDNLDLLMLGGENKHKGSRYNKEVKDLLNLYEKKFETEKLTTEKFILATAYKYLLNTGWGSEKFTGYKDQNDIFRYGLDSAIAKKYTPSTHGQKSKVMTFAEKYIWEFKNILIGFLSDYIPVGGFNTSIDYGTIENVPSAFIDTSQNYYISHLEDKIYFSPSEFSMALHGEITKEKLKNWVVKGELPDVGKWISFKDEKGANWVNLYGYHNIPNQTGGESILWSSSLLIENRDLENLISDVGSQRSILMDIFSEPSKLETSIVTDCYISPREVILSPWINEYNEGERILTILDGKLIEYDFHYTASECVINSNNDDDKYYHIPSKMMRDLLNIKDGNGFKTYDEEGDVVTIFETTTSSYQRMQSTLRCRSENLYQRLDGESKQIVWISRIMRGITHEASKLFENINYRRDEYYITWNNNGEFKTVLFNKEID